MNHLLAFCSSLVALPLALCLWACDSAVGTDPQCQLPPPGEEVGSWRVLPYPEEEGRLSASLGASDGTNFLMVSGKKCDTCEVQVLSEDAASWSSIAAQGVAISNDVGRQTASDRYIASVEVSTSDENNHRTYPWQVALFDRSTNMWSYTDFPTESAQRADTSIHIFGTNVVIWGGFTPVNPDSQEGLPGTPRYGGYVFDPDTQEFETIAPAWEEGASTRTVGGQTSSVLTPDGLFAWGVNAEQSLTRGGLYSFASRTWSYSSESVAPPRRRYFQTSYHNGFVYLWGGHLPEAGASDALGNPVGGGRSDFSQHYRDLWRLSLTDLTWEELPVPKHADLQGAKGAWIADELVFVGYRCGPPDLLNVETMEWRQGGYDGRSADPGWLYSASNKIISNGVHPTFGLVAHAVWVFEIP